MAELKSPDKKKNPVGVSQANKNGKGRFISSESWKKSMEKAAAMRNSKAISGTKKRKLSYGSDENGSESDDTSAQQLKKRKREHQVNVDYIF